jgi:hypothetical protein
MKTYWIRVCERDGCSNEFAVDWKNCPKRQCSLSCSSRVAMAREGAIERQIALTQTPKAQKKRYRWF